MSYDVELIDETGDVITVDEKHYIRGGTYQVGGSNELSLNITYNYYPHFRETLGENGIRSIYGKKAIDTIPILAEAAKQLKDDISEDYWEPTEGNAREALLQLIQLATMAPDGVWAGD